MGPLCPSKSMNSIQENQMQHNLQEKQISYVIKKTNIKKFDNLFNKAQQHFIGAEKIRMALSVKRDQMNDFAYIKSISDGTFNDSIQSFIWAVSASYEGHIIDSNLGISDSEPYVSVNGKHLHGQTFEFSECLKVYIRVCIESPQQLKNMLEEVHQMNNDGSQMLINLSQEIQQEGSELNAIQKQQVAQIFNLNMKVLKNGELKMEKLLEVAQKDHNELPHVIKSCALMIEYADEIGKTAFENKHTTPRECIQYNMKEKKSKEQIIIADKLRLQQKNQN